MAQENTEQQRNYVTAKRLPEQEFNVTAKRLQSEAAQELSIVNYELSISRQAMFLRNLRYLRAFDISRRSR